MPDITKPKLSAAEESEIEVLGPSDLDAVHGGGVKIYLTPMPGHYGWTYGHDAGASQGGRPIPDDVLMGAWGWDKIPYD